MAPRFESSIGQQVSPPAWRSAGKDVIGLKIRGPEWIGNFYVDKVQFEPEAFVDPNYARDGGEEDGSAAGATPARDTPDIWGKVDCAAMQRVCRALGSPPTAKLVHYGRLITLEISDSRFVATAYFAYNDTTDQRFESTASRDEVDELERKVALYGLGGSS